MTRRVQEKELRTSMCPPSQETEPKLKQVKILKTVEFDPHYGGVFSLQYNFDGSLVAAGFAGGGVILYNPLTGEKVRELRPHRHGGYQVMCMRFHPKIHNVLFVSTSEGHVYAIKTDTGEGAKNPIIKEDKNEINTIDFSVEGFEFCTCGKDLAVRVYDTKAFKEKKTYEGYGLGMSQQEQNLEAGNTMRVFSLKFHPDKDDILLTAGWDNHIKIWDIRTNDGIKRQFYGPHVCGDAMDIRGNTILTGSWRTNKALQESDFGEGKIIRDLPFPNDNGAFLYCAQFANVHTVMAGGSGTNSVEVIDRDDMKHLGGVKMTKTVMALDSSKDGRLFAVGGEDHVIKFCAME